jgi:hypothetical protein
MKKWGILVFCVFFGVTRFLTAATGQKNSVKTRVTVRVFDRESLVKDLKEADFTVTENHRPVTLSGFTVTRRILAPVPARTSSRRLLVLEFYLHQYGAAVRKGIDFVFRHILVETDSLLVVSGGQTLFFPSIPDKTGAIGLIEERLSKQATLTRLQMEAELEAMGKFIDEVRTQANQDVDSNAGIGRMSGVHPHYYMKYLKNSIERYLDMLLAYRQKFLLPDFSRYDNLPRQLRDTDGEKWLISFRQMPQLPKFSSRNRQMINDWIRELSKREWLDELDYTRKLERLQGGIDTVFHVSGQDTDQWIREEIQALYRAGFTFHAVFLPVNPEPGSHRPGKAAAVSSSIESAMKYPLKEIARLTGGTFTAVETGQAETELGTLLEKEDVYYTLTFSPREAAEESLKVEARQPRYHAVYHPSTGPEKPQPLPLPGEISSSHILIESMAFTDKKLSLLIGGFAVDQPQTKGDRGAGKLRVRIRIIDRRNRVVFDKEKALLAQKKRVSLALDFKWLERGKYDFVVSAGDWLTGKAWTQVSVFEVQ